MGERAATRYSRAGFMIYIACILFLGFAFFTWGRSWLQVLFGLSGGVFTLFLAMFCTHLSRKNPADSHSIITLLFQYMLYCFPPLQFFRWWHERKMITAAKECYQSQEKVLLEILENEKNTEYGKQYGFADITSAEEFRQKHPLTSYSHYEDYIKRTVDGERMVMVSEDMVHIAMTSGTTGGVNKYFPITDRINVKHLGRLCMGRMWEIMKDVPLGRILALRHKPKMTKSVQGVNIGPLSAYTAPHFPHHLSPSPAFEISSETSALYVHALFGLADPEVCMIDGLMSGLVYTFFRLIENNWRDLCTDIERGSIRRDPDIPREVRNKLNHFLKPNADRAQQLRQIFGEGFDNIGLRLWPNLKVVQMQASGGFLPYTQYLLDTYIKGVTVMCLAHGASEGLAGVNLETCEKDKTYITYTPLPHTAGFLEYIEEEHIHDKKPPTPKLLGELEKGKSYEIVITNTCGLYRYRLGDVIKVVDYFHDTPLPIYEFQYRVGQLLNLLWEKTPENIFYEALMKSLSKLPGDIKMVDYTTTENHNWEKVTKKNTNIKHYVLFVELSRNPRSVASPPTSGASKADKQKARASKSVTLSEQDKKLFDEQLCADFELYGQLRDDRSISRMLVIQIATGGFQKLKLHMTKATNNQQFKMPRVLRNVSELRVLQQSVSH